VTIELSIVAPVFNEEDGIETFHRRLLRVLEQANVSFEILYIDDGSVDKSLNVLLKIVEHDYRTRVIKLSRNFGHQLAITAGLDYSVGNAVIVIDADLQDPPEAIMEMLEIHRQGFDVVYGVRVSRTSESRFKRATAKFFYRLLSRLSDQNIPVDAGDFRLLDRKVVEALKKCPENNRYMRGLVSWVGFRQAPLEYHRERRKIGSSHYPFSKMVLLALDGITSFSDKPLKVVLASGMTLSISSFVYMFYAVLLRILDPANQALGFTAIISLITLMAGIQLVSLGLIGLYVSRIFKESKGRPLYIVERDSRRNE